MRNINWRRILPVTAVIILLLILALPGGILANSLTQETAEAEIEPDLLKELAAEGQTDFFVWMSEKADLSPAYELETKLEKGTFVYNTLTETANRTQKDLLAYLDSQGIEYRSYYIANKVLVYGGDTTLVMDIAARDDVASLMLNHQYQLQEPFKVEAPSVPTVVEPNITFVNADDVWALGVNGSGTLMAGNDTGLDWDHPALINQYRGWNGSMADHNYNWWDATGTYPTVPGDGHGHGTHTTGTMVGDDGGTNQIGVAPGAQTIHCKNMTDGGSGSDQTFSDCFEWDLAPWDLTGANPDPSLAPDAVNNSWGYAGGNQPQFMDEIDALQAAGILVEVSAGNEGSGCTTLRSPSDYEQVLTTGSVQHSGGVLPGTITGFSSRGPSLIDGDYFPDIMAPGENIRSSVPGGTYEGGWSGTSMSGPHVTALVGLMWSANPALAGDIATTTQMIIDTAVPLSGQNGSNCGGDYTDGPNNDWGYGTIDSLAAVQMAMQYGGSGDLVGTVTEDGSGDPIEGAEIDATLSVTQTWQATTDANGDYAMTVLSGTYTVDVSAFGYLPESVSGVPVISGTMTIVDFSLTPAASSLVYGYVTDANTGWPLYAKIVVGGSPYTIWTDPVTGYYEVSLPEGSSYTLDVDAFSDGYFGDSRVVGPLVGDTQEDFALDTNPDNCVAPGYELNVTGVFEDFNGGTFPPAGWTVVNNGGACEWVGDDPGGRGNLTGGSGAFAIADSDECGSGTTMDTTMYSPVSDVSALTNIFLEFAYDYNNLSSSEVAAVDVSADGGTTWTNINTWNSDQRGPATFTQDVTTELGGSTQAQIRFHYVAPGWDWWWEVDDVFMGEKSCDPLAGGLVVGNVYDENTSSSLVGAMVENEAGYMTYAVETPEDPDVDDGFYTLFSPSGSQVFTATFEGFGPDVETVSVVADDTVGQDFYLPSGQLVITPDGLSANLELGNTSTVQLDLDNVGTFPVAFEISERDTGFSPTSIGKSFDEPTFVVSSADQDQFTAEGLGIPAAPSAAPLAAGDVIQSWTPTEAGTAAWGIAFDGMDDTVWVSEGWGNDNTWEYTPDGTYTGQSWPYTWNPANGPADLTFNWNTGMLWVMDVAGDDCIHEVDPASGVTGSTICPGFTTSQRGLAYDPETDTYLAGSWNDLMVYRFDSNGTILEQANTGLSVSGLAYNPETMHLFVMVNASPNNVYVLDAADSYNQIGQFSVSEAFGDFAGAGLEFDCDGNLWAVDQGIDTVYQFESGETAALCGGDVLWLSEDPITGTVGVGANLPVDVTFDSGQVFQPGTYYADLRIADDTPYDTATVPVTMTVTAPADWGKLEGTISGLGYCDDDFYALDEAEVYIETSTGMTHTLYTNAAGYYSIWLDEAESTVDVMASYPGHLSESAFGVVISGGVTETVNLDLRLAAPCVSVSPDSLAVTLDLGDNDMLTLDLTNDGAVATDFEITERDGGYQPTLVGVTPMAVPRARLAGYDANAMSTAGILEAGGTAPMNILAAGDVLAQWPSGLALPWGTGYGGDSDTVWLSNPSAGGGDDNNHEYETDGTVTGNTVPASFGGSWAGDMAYNANTGMYWQVNVGGDNCIHEWDPSSGATGNSICDAAWTFTSQRGLAYDPETDTYFIGGWNDTNVYHIDNTGVVIEQWALSLSVSGLAYNHEAGYLFIMENSATDTVSVVDVSAGTIVNSFTVAGFGNFAGAGLAIDCEGNLWASNQTDGNAYLIDSGVPASLCGGDVIWLSEDPITGTLSANGGMETIDVTFDAATVTQPGEYYATLKVKTDDPVNGNYSVPVTMTVLATGDIGKLNGTVSGLGYCDADSYPLEDAEVTVESAGNSWMLTTDDMGYYSIWVDAANSPLTVTVSYPEHEYGMETDVTVTAGMTTTVDFDLRWLSPCVSVAPDEYEVTLGLGFSMTLPLSLTNAGAYSTPFELAEKNGGYQPTLVGVTPMAVPRARLAGYDANAMSTAGILEAGGTAPMNILAAGDVLAQWPSGLALPWGTGYGGDSDTVWLSNPSAGGGDDNNHEYETDGTVTGNTVPASFGGSWAGDMAYNANTGMYWQVNVGGDNCIHEWDPSSGATGNSICDAAWTFTSQRGLAYDPETDTYFIGGWNDTNVYHIDNTGVVIEQWALSLSVSGLAYNHEAGYLFIMENSATDTVSVVDVSAGTIVNSFTVAGFGNFAGAGLAIDCEGNLWASNQTDGNAYLIDSGVPASLCASTDIPWLSEDPITGTVAADSTEMIDLTFDASVVTETGTYTGTLIVKTDDSMYGSIEIPVTLHVEEPDPGISLEVTLSTDGTCGTTDTLTVTEGDVVYYCYTVTNMGNVMLDSHTITETVYGHMDTFTYELYPTMSESVMYTHTMTAVETITSTATWDAEHAGMGMEASASDTTVVTVEAIEYMLYLPVIMKP